MPEKRTSSLWNPYALIALGLIAFVLLMGMFSDPKHRQSQVDLTGVYDGDRYVKTYLFEQSIAIKGLADAHKSISRHERSDLSTALDIYNKPALRNTPAAIRRVGVLMNQLHKPGAAEAFNRLCSPKTYVDLPKRDKRDLADEAAMWRDIYTAKTLDRTQAIQYANKIDDLNLGPTKAFALEHVFDLASMKTESQQIATTAKDNAVSSFVGLILLVLAVCAASIAGLVLFIMFLGNWDKHIPSQEAQAPGETEETPEANESPNDGSAPSDVLLGGFVMFLVVSILLGLIARLTLKPGLENLPSNLRLIKGVELQFGLSLASGLIAFAFLYARIKQLGLSIAVIGLTKKELGKNILWGLGGYCVVLPLLIATSFLWEFIQKAFLPGVATPPNPVVPWLMSGNSIVLFFVFLMVSVLAPIFEEIFFRGALYGSLRARYGFKLAIPISAAAFALMHPFPGGFLPIFAIGAVFSVLYETRKSLAPSIVAHALNNSLMFVGMYLLSVK